MLLDLINEPADLRQLDDEQLDQLATEIREFIVEAVSRTGGHLGSNLGRSSSRWPSIACSTLRATS